MDALVTGGTGFVGANLVRELLADGRTVRVLARPGSDRRALEGCRVEIAEGDLLDRDSLRAAVAGARRVYHVAADYRLWARDSRELYRANQPCNSMSFFIGVEVYDHLEKVVDRFDDVANEIHGIVLENV